MYIVNPLVTRGVTRRLNPKKVLQGGQVGTGGVVVVVWTEEMVFYRHQVYLVHFLFP
jgi:hypothetical protein